MAKILLPWIFFVSTIIHLLCFHMHKDERTRYRKGPDIIDITDGHHEVQINIPNYHFVIIFRLKTKLNYVFEMKLV